MNDYNLEHLENWLDDLKNEPPTNILLAQRALRNIKEDVPSCIRGLPEPDIYYVEKRKRLIREIEEKISEYRLAERRKRLRPISVINEDRQKVKKVDLIVGNDKDAKKIRGRKSKSFVECVVADTEKCMSTLHKVMKNKVGKEAALIIRVAIINGWIEKPTFKAVTDEFGDIGHRSGFNKYMDNNYKFSEDELMGAKAQLGL